MARKKEPTGPTLPTQIEHWPLARLVPYALNSKLHTPEQVADIAGSIREFGWTNPILVDEAGLIIAGHGRVLAAQLIGMAVVPVIVFSHLTDVQTRRLRIADNRHAENAPWIEEMLKQDVRGIAEAGGSTAGLGFAEDQIAALLADVSAGHTDPDAAPPLPTTPVTQLGDVWVLGNHRLICGDATDPQVVARVLGPVRPMLMVTDQPYGVEYEAEWRNNAPINKGNAKGKRAVAKVTNDDRSDWSDVWRNFPGDIAYIWHAAGEMSDLQRELKTCGFILRAQIIWAKDRAVVSRGHYHWQHEPCWYAVRNGGTAEWKGDRKQTTVWQISHVKSETGHSTQKPVEAMQRPIDNHTSPGQAVFDPFVGSGTTLMACELTARVCYAIELEPAFCDVVVKRWQAFTQREALHEGKRHRANPQTFADIARARGVELAA